MLNSNTCHCVLCAGAEVVRLLCPCGVLPWPAVQGSRSSQRGELQPARDSFHRRSPPAGQWTYALKDSPYVVFKQIFYNIFVTWYPTSHFLTHVSFALSIMLISVINKAQRKQHLENFLCQHLHLVTVEKAMRIVLKFCWPGFAPPLYQTS